MLYTFFYSASYFLIYFIDYAITVPLFPLCPSLPSTPIPSRNLPIMHISSLASPFPILFLTFPCLFCTYQLCFLFRVPFSPFPADNSPNDLHIYGSVSVLLVCLVCFLDSIVDSCVVLILTFS